jgi:uncharacterized membrane protein YoaK (UPF0700 family)
MATKTTSTLRFALLVTAASGFLDAYTFLARGGVFANVQTGNVVLFFIDLSERHFTECLDHVWPIVAFLLGVTLATHVKTGKLDHLVRYPLRWTMAVHVLTLAIIGFVPESVPNLYVTVPIAFMGAMQLELFRSIGDLNYMVVATTGNLMRMVDTAYSMITTKSESDRIAFRTYRNVTFSFSVGAATGACATQWLGVHAIWLASAFLAVTLVFFVLDERGQTEQPATAE